MSFHGRFSCVKIYLDGTIYFGLTYSPRIKAGGEYVKNCRPEVGVLGGYFCAKHQDRTGDNDRTDNDDLPAHRHTPFPGA